MEYSVNPQVMFGLSFSVPASVTDKHLKLAGSAQLKVLLWLLRHASEAPTVQQLCKALNMSAADANDAMQYWVECGIVLADGSPAPVQQPVQPEAAAVAPDAKVFAPLPESKPTMEQIAKRADESTEIRFLLNEAQTKLGRTIGYDSQATLLMIHDTYGLPVEVLLMLIEYCVAINKNSLNYISRVAKTWGEDEIDSIEKADERIKALRRCDGLWKKLCEFSGIQNPRPTASQSTFLRRWNGEFGFDIEMICLAYEEMADHTDKISFPYMNRVLTNWHDAGIKTPTDVDESKKARASEPAAKKGKKKDGYDSSYDLDEYMRHSMQDPIVYKKTDKTD